MGNTLKILLKPSYAATAEKLGYDNDDSYAHADDILFQIGYDMVEIEVSQGDVFTISTEFEEGTVSLEDVNYKIMSVKNGDQGDDEDEFEDNYESDLNYLILSPGIYKFHNDGITIEKVSDLFDEDDL